MPVIPKPEFKPVDVPVIVPEPAQKQVRGTWQCPKASYSTLCP